MQEPRKCLLVQDDAGNMYYLRPEILEATRMSPEELETCRRRAAEHGVDLKGLDLATREVAANPCSSGPFRALNSLAKIRPPGESKGL